MRVLDDIENSYTISQYKRNMMRTCVFSITFILGLNINVIKYYQWLFLGIENIGKFYLLYAILDIPKFLQLFIILFQLENKVDSGCLYLKALIHDQSKQDYSTTIISISSRFLRQRKEKGMQIKMERKCSFLCFY